MKNVFTKLIYIISIISFAFFTYILLKNRLFPWNYRIVFFSVMGVLFLAASILIFRDKLQGKAKFAVAVLLCLALAVNAAGGYYVKKSMDMLDKINVKSPETVTMSVVVPVSSRINEMDAALDEKIEAPVERDGENTDRFVAAVKETYTKTAELIDCGSYFEGANRILTGESHIMLLNEAYRSIIEEQMPDFAKKTRVVGSIQLAGEKSPAKEKEDEPGEPFSIYLSGIDTYGDLTKVSRSDTNLILSVNPNTKKVLITTVPRDTYLPIAGGGNGEYDKLTHSGIYGIDSSIETVENFLGIKIDYYARINFTSLIEIVDVLGGIDVENEEEFTTVDDQYFEQGIIHLDGKRALRFAQERDSLSDGDIGRGRNHERIIKAILQKMQSKEILLHYEGVMDVIYRSMDTNISKELVIDMINKQLKSGTSWQIDMAEISGTGTTGLASYAMPGYDLYVMVPDEESVADVKSRINELLRGK